jgi:hypothetical protein
MELKTCIDCKIEYPKTLEYFHKNGKGLISYCKKCNIKRIKEYRIKNPNHAKKTSFNYYQNNKEIIINKIKEYRINNKEKLNVKKKETSKKYRKNNRETIKEKAKKYRENNKEKAKEYRENNKEKFKQYHKNMCENLTDYYIKVRLKKTKEDIPNEIIETKRLTLQLKRELKTIKN